jgi:heterodisulfide reductase subunit C
MKIELDGTKVHGELCRKVEAISGQKLLTCYQCGNCTAGCPMAFAMEVGPHQVIRWLLLGLTEEAMAGNTIRLCASCQQCTARCPRGIDIARVMDAVRTMMLRETGRKNDIVRVADIDRRELEKMPQIAFIGAFRKFLS